jgi:hypothetical protein
MNTLQFVYASEQHCPSRHLPSGTVGSSVRVFVCLALDCASSSNHPYGRSWSLTWLYSISWRAFFSSWLFSFEMQRRNFEAVVNIVKPSHLYWCHVYVIMIHHKSTLPRSGLVNNRLEVHNLDITFAFVALDFLQIFLSCNYQILRCILIADIIQIDWILHQCSLLQLLI